MTFYWWSHWFWITLLSNLIFPLTVIVHTYPSQGSIQEYNQNQENNTKKLVTKLYQSSNVLAWTTDMPTSTKNTATVDNLKLENVVQVHKVTNLENSTKDSDALINNNEEEEYYYDADTTDDVTEKLNLEQMEVEMERKGENLFSSNKSEEENDVKRSAENTNKENLDKSEIELLTTSTLASLEKRNNYTNFADKTTSINMTATNNTSNSSDNTLITNISTQTSTIPIVGITNTTTIQLSQAPATPKIVKAQTDNLDWLNRIANQLPPAHITTNVTQNYPEDQHKMPFTLENVNKPEDLKREESEYRSRKSKGLSAEYKVNRYINYSSESKNLLTRSASTTVNEYDSEESNISSEALSVQRAYFMDVGAISAICFTVFGICCTVGTIGLVLYRRRFLNKPQALSEPDSSVYIDDSTMRVSDNSDEMYSLDNDSFLNSLEAMTIQNYWTDTVKHTKL